MPRLRSEAAACLDVYKLVVERKRLEQELEKLEARRNLIVQRLAQLDQNIAALDQTVHTLRNQPTPEGARPHHISAQEPPPRRRALKDRSQSSSANLSAQPSETEHFNTFTLDY